jgi:hypothetical protein
MDAIGRARPPPKVEFPRSSAAGLWDRPLLATRSQDVRDPLLHVPRLDTAWIAAALGVESLGQQGPFLVGQSAGISRRAAVVATSTGPN